ncbi:cilia- and flagella-associated protein [Apis mellifera carnica]|nr:cilia- and flagella-associated protein [Apis mellifera carnica]
MGRIEDQVVTKAINNFTIHLAAAKCYFEQAVETSVVEKINLEEKELTPEEAEFIQKIKSKINVVRSMERLYAVPSEQLRVWLIWLSKVGDMADEWHKWLRSHIDFVLRLSIELRAAEEVLTLEQEKEEEIEKKEIEVETKVETKEIETDTKEETKKEENSNNPGSENSNNPGSENSNNPGPEDSNNPGPGNPNDEEEVKEEREEEEEEKKEELITEEEEKEEEERREEEEETVVTEIVEEKEDVEVKEEEEEEKPSIVITEEEEEEERRIMKEWPVGIPWEHLGIEEEEEKLFDDRLPIPKNEVEMKDFLRKFTHEATIHRSSFKHWKETADQAVKEIGNRLVMATFLVQGKDQTGEVKKPAPKKVLKKVKSVQKKSKKRKSPVRKEEEVEEPEDSKLEMTLNRRDLIRKMMEVDADDLVKDSARGMEPLPYIFYLKVEPDIDIAIEHDDENVILADTERENITGDYQKLYFNLSDKPCKGGKPWIL